MARILQGGPPPTHKAVLAAGTDIANALLSKLAGLRRRAVRMARGWHRDCVIDWKVAQLLSRPPLEVGRSGQATEQHLPSRRPRVDCERLDAALPQLGASDGASSQAARRLGHMTCPLGPSTF